ncbi:hypothetical protein EU537_11905 [Candidatus Thorarchaeota archaeon]|nr:MAG: hypothetical protein EU537_11905 [Candidatus Thorarchaeota archaeon]
MNPVEKFNPLKSSAATRKVKSAKGGKRRAELEEITFETVKQDAMGMGLATDVLYQMSAGKEASIFLAAWKDHPIVLKAYRIWQSSHSLSKSSGFRTQASSKRTYSALHMMENFAVAEYDLLMRCFQAGMRVPTPIGRVCNYLTMRLIGDGTVPGPQLREVTLEEPDLVLDQILDDYLIMYRDVHYVHGDLSEYNILWWDDKPWIIDVPQGYHVGVHCNMLKAEKLLRRDIRNLLAHFKSYGIRRNIDEILDVFLSSYVPANQKYYKELAPQGGELL